jgi:hypothetical protein
VDFIDLLFHLGIAIYLYFQAPHYGKNKWIWAGFGLVFEFLALGIFMLKINQKVYGWIFIVIFVTSLVLDILAFVL